MKRCPDCGIDKPLVEFPRSRARTDGHGTYCSSCYSIRYRQHRERLATADGKTLRPQRAVPQGHAWCPRCQQELPLEDFGKNAGARNGRTAYCRPCHNLIMRENRQRNHGSTRNYHLKRRYGLTAADVDAMVEAQGGVCALCRERAPEHVDHDHLTGQVRGVLCSCCNQGLGNFRDRAQLLRAAVDYLEATTWQRDVRIVRQEAGVYALVPS